VYHLKNVFDISDGTYVDKLMKTYANSNQDISHEDDNVKRGYSIENSEYTDLDLHGVGYDVLRKPGESDRDYRERIIANLTAPKNTKQAILDALQPHVYNAWIFEWMGNWEDDYCFFLDWSFMDYRDYLGGGLGYGDGTDPFTFEVHVRPLMESKTETQPSVGLSTVTTDYSILSVVGVWDNSAKTGTNYYLPVPPGTFSDRTITLGTPLTSHPSTVYVEYVTQEILRKIADVIDKTKPAGTKAYVIIERGAYYGEEVYGVPYYGG